MDKVNINFSKKVIKKLKEEDKNLFPNVYQKAAIAVGFIITILSIFAIFISFNHFNKSYAKSIPQKTGQNIIFPSDEDWVEFYFDKDGNFLLADK